MPTNPIVHFEIGCQDKVAARDFYSRLFEWRIDHLFQIAADTAGLSGHMTALGHEPHKYTIFYVQVEDVAASCGTAEKLGGKRLVGPVSIPNGTFAWIQDPEGNTVGMWKPAQKPKTSSEPVPQSIDS